MLCNTISSLSQFTLPLTGGRIFWQCGEHYQYIQRPDPLMTNAVQKNDTAVI